MSKCPPTFLDGFSLNKNFLLKINCFLHHYNNLSLLLPSPSLSLSLSVSFSFFFFFFLFLILFHHGLLLEIIQLILNELYFSSFIYLNLTNPSSYMLYSISFIKIFQMRPTSTDILLFWLALTFLHIHLKIDFLLCYAISNVGFFNYCLIFFENLTFHMLIVSFPQVDLCYIKIMTFNYSCLATPDMIL